jgi:Protein of unknown function (DUF3298)/Deacetylase PdaC
MKKKDLFLLCALVFHTLVQAQPVSWYRQFTGTIDKYPIVLHLHKAGDSYSGFYYYEKTQRPFRLSGTQKDTSVVPGQIRLAAYIPGNESTDETLILSITGNTLSGTWRKDEQSKALSITGIETKKDSLSFDMIYVDGTQELKPSLENSPSASYTAATIWPHELSPAGTYIRRLINGLFGHKNSSEDIGRFLLKQKTDFMDGYRKDNQDVADSEVASFPSSYSLEEDQDILILYRSAGLLTLANTNYSYTGGAHGNYGTTYSTIDLGARKEVTLADVITVGGKKPLGALLEKFFRKDFKLSAGQALSEAGLFEDKIAPTENFFLTGKGIGFGYQPYEIGPYAMGEIVIFIPYTELSGLLKPGFKKFVQ